MPILNTIVTQCRLANGTTIDITARELDASILESLLDTGQHENYHRAVKWLKKTDLSLTVDFDELKPYIFSDKITNDPILNDNLVIIRLRSLRSIT